MAKRVATGRRGGNTRGRPAGSRNARSTGRSTRNVRSRAQQIDVNDDQDDDQPVFTNTRSGGSGDGRGRRTKSMDDYLREDEEYENSGMFERLQQQADTVLDDSYYDDGRTHPRRGNNRGNNQYTVNTGGRGGNRGSSRNGQLRQLINNFAEDLVNLIGE